MILSPRLPLGIRNCRRGGKKNVRRLLKSFMLHCFTLFEFLIIITYYCFKSWEKGRPLPSVEMYSFSLTLRWVYSLLVVWTRITLQCVIPLHSEDDKLLTGTGLHVHPREPQSLSSWLSEVPHTGSSSDGGRSGSGTRRVQGTVSDSDLPWLFSCSEHCWPEVIWLSWHQTLLLLKPLSLPVFICREEGHRRLGGSVQ